MRNAACMDVTYSTYEDSKQKPLPCDAVDLIVEKVLMVEVGGWGTMLKFVIRDSKVKVITENNITTVLITPNPKTETSLLTQGNLVASIGKTIEEVNL